MELGTAKIILFSGSTLSEEEDYRLHKSYKKRCAEECDKYVTKRSAEKLVEFQRNSVIIQSAKFARHIHKLLTTEGSTFFREYSGFMLPFQLDKKYIHEWLKNNFKKNTDSPVIKAHRDSKAVEIKTFLDLRIAEKDAREAERHARGTKRLLEQFERQTDIKKKQQIARIARYETVTAASKKCVDELTPLFEKAQKAQETARKAMRSATEALANDAPSSSDDDDDDDDDGTTGRLQGTHVATPAAGGNVMGQKSGVR